MRSAGGVLLAIGALALLIRKSGDHSWTDFDRLLVVAVPALALYGLALRGDVSPREGAEPSQTVLMVTAILLAPLALFLLLRWAGASTRHVLYPAGVFAVTGGLAAYGARTARVSYAALLGALAALVAWLLLWDKLLGHPHADTFRWLLIAGALALLLVAAALATAGAIGAGEVATAGGIAAVSAGIFGVVVGAALSVFHVFTYATSVTPAGSSRLPTGHPPTPHSSALQHFGWDVYLLLASLVLVWIGSRARVRGLGYVGAAGLLALATSVGAQITRLEVGKGPTRALLGWPLVLLIVGAVGLILSTLDTIGGRQRGALTARRPPGGGP
jgi:hypothetical protein